MLRIIQNRSAAGAKSYYSKADYYTEQQELTGRWGGKGAARLGLTGSVRQQEFDAICENRDPRSGGRLTARTDSDRTIGYDFNFHAPKGVSVVYALTGDKRILETFQASVRETMEELESEAKTRVRRDKRDEDRITGNLCWAEFVHLTARPVDGIPDPHLHAHCFTFNNTFDTNEQRWKAAQFRDLKRDARYFEAAFHARFAKGLAELGYGIERRGKGWDLTEVPKEIADRFSRRTQLIERMAEAKDIDDPEQKSELGAKSREKKRSELSMVELREIWQGRLSQIEQERIAVIGNRTPARTVERDADARSLDHAIVQCFERKSVVGKKDLLGTALRHSVGRVTVEGVKESLKSKDVISGSYRGRELITTREVAAEEKAMLAFARDGRGGSRPLNSAWRIQRDWLNKEQRAAVRHVLESRDRVVLVKGRAGTGKTTLMQETVEGIEAGGRQVFTFAPSAEASRGVLAAEGFSNATTVAELLVNERLQEAAAGHVLWIDEAGLLGTRTMKRVFDIAERIDCRIVLSGDWKQHASPERGGGMRLLAEEGGIKPAIVSRNQRQQPMDYRAVVDLVADGHVIEGLEQMDRLGWIREADDANRNEQIARDHAELVAAGESALVICPTHAEGERVNQAIRTELKAKGFLREEERSFTRLIPLHLTEAERSDPSSYESDDVIVFHQNAKGRRKGERIKVDSRVPEELTQAARHFQVYREGRLAIAENELIRVTANGKTKDGKHRLNNGSTYRVQGFTDLGDLKLENGWVVDKQFGFLGSGWTLTSHAAQGKTVQHVLIAEPSHSFGAASLEQFYVSVSRGRVAARVYTDNKQALKAAVCRSDERLTATDLIRGDVADRENRRLQAARAKTIAEGRSQQRERDWELLYG